MELYVIVFFFSSRRRHTRCGRDWSSDVCSSDLHEGDPPEGGNHAGEARAERPSPVVEVHPAEDPLEAPGDGEDPEDVARVVVDPAVEPRLAGDEDVHVGLGDRELDVLDRLSALHTEGHDRPGLVSLYL